MDPSSLDDLRELLGDFEAEMRHKNRSDGTIKLYRRHVLMLVEYLEANELPTTAPEITREHLRDYLTNLLERPNRRTGKALSPQYAHGVYRSLQQLWKYLYAEEIIDSNPFDRIEPPSVPEKPTPVPATDDLRALLKACEGTGHAERRDAAVIRLLVDTGMRVGELIGLEVESLDFAENTALIVGKGERPRVVPFGDRTRTALRRYLRVRSQHHAAHISALWLGRRGRMTGDGVRQMLKSRCKQAKIDHIHPHQLRHFFAHNWLAAGGQEQDLMMLAGWRSRQMLARYGASVASERAREAHRRARPGDQL
ncbi:tyrosine-type recombinase/integrase [Haloechinothrix aidingensis]|nr:tyrosine-type recombinase/integrase [Haloechinothrix aidingensis]